MKRKIKFIVVLLMLMSGKSFSQQSFTHFTTLQSLKINILSSNAFYQSDSVKTRMYSLNKPANQVFYSNQLILPDYYTQHFGFFCQKELQFEKTTKIPLRFRLGSLDYCNKLEGK